MTLSTRMSLEVQHVVAIAMLLLMAGLPLSAGVLMVMRMLIEAVVLTGRML